MITAFVFFRLLTLLLFGTSLPFSIAFDLLLVSQVIAFYEEAVTFANKNKKTKTR